MEDFSAARLSDLKYGFRSDRSTIDTLHRVVALIERSTITRKEFATGISWDVRNAFNSLS